MMAWSAAELAGYWQDGLLTPREVFYAFVAAVPREGAAQVAAAVPAEFVVAFERDLMATLDNTKTYSVGSVQPVGPPPPAPSRSDRLAFALALRERLDGGGVTT